ncbi:MAG: universal stress protein [Caldilineaceae bacterium]
MMSVPYKKILVPLDGSELAKQALPHAEDLATRMGATLVLIQVVQPLTEKMMVAPGFAVTMQNEPAVDTAVDEAHDRLATYVEHLHRLHISAETMVAIGDPAGKIVDYADGHKIDLIVMSTHGHSGITRWRYGSVTTKVLSAASCPVLVIRPSAVV